MDQCVILSNAVVHIVCSHIFPLYSRKMKIHLAGVNENIFFYNVLLSLISDPQLFLLSGGGLKIKGSMRLFRILGSVILDFLSE